MFTVNTIGGQKTARNCAKQIFPTSDQFLDSSCNNHLSLSIYIIVDDYYLADIKFIINFIYLFLYEILYWLIYVEIIIMDMTDVTISSILGCRMHFSFIARDVLESATV